ncbi:MAG: polysaccharide deacetylase family protein [Solirubrobacterales bacterium]
MPTSDREHTASIAPPGGIVTDVLVLCYHAVSEDWGADLSVTPARLESQVESVLGRGYRGVTFHDAVHSAPPGKTLAVTFDDAYRSVIELALPVLSRLGVPATVFVPTSFTGTERPMSWPGIDHWIGGPHEDELMPMSWEELAALADAGWEIGAHTRTHPYLTQLDDPALAEELEASRRDCEAHLDAPCRSFAYPYSDEDERVVEAAGKAGFSAAGTLPATIHPASPLHWPRVGVYAEDDAFRFRLKTSPWMLRLRAGRDWRVPPAIWKAREAARSVVGRGRRG